jgi:fructokinase
MGYNEGYIEFRAGSEKRIVCFGEILWDILPGGAVPGGAPFNVAYHLKKLGYDPLLVTRAGRDEWGDRLLRIMEVNKISTHFFQHDPGLPTGKVCATIGEDHEVHYEITEPVAWDNIMWDTNIDAIVGECGYFLCGSLAARNDVSRNTLFRLLESAFYKIIDINLRPPFYNRQTIETLLHHADLLKVNQSELELISGWYTDMKLGSDQMKFLQDRFKIPSIVLTKGAAGAVLLDEERTYSQEGFTVKVADTVGSGDAFLAGLVSGLMGGKEQGESLRFATAMGALVAGYPGPCPVYDLETVEKLIKGKFNNQI